MAISGSSRRTRRDCRRAGIGQGAAIERQPCILYVILQQTKQMLLEEKLSELVETAAPGKPLMGGAWRDVEVCVHT